MKEIKTVGIVGRGAIGVIFGHIIQKSFNDNLIFIVDKERLSKYHQYPLYCNHQLCDFHYCNDVKTFIQVDLMIYAMKFPALVVLLKRWILFIKIMKSIILKQGNLL